MEWRRELRAGAAGVAAVGALAIASAANADSINIESDVLNSEHQLGEFVGTITYTYDANSMMGMLLVELTNTSDADNGGYITAFVFNVDGDVSLDFDEDASTDPFSGHTNVDGAPFGTYEYGASIGDGNGNFGDSGQPSQGLGVGEDGLFKWVVTGNDAANLSAEDFIAAEDDQYGFAVRFRGFDNNGSDKVPGTVVLIPVPPAVWMGLAGLGVVGVAARRRRIA